MIEKFIFTGYFLLIVMALALTYVAKKKDVPCHKVATRGILFFKNPDRYIQKKIPEIIITRWN